MDKMMERRFVFEPYSDEWRSRWEEFVGRSRNATFLFSRDYMEYHADRFPDASLIALCDGKPIALLPACRLEGDMISTHAGLTYGGWILPERHVDGAMLLHLMEQWVEWCRANGFKAIHYKPIPSIYASTPSEEDRYALWRCGFSLAAVNLSSAVDMRQPVHFNMNKRRQLKKASRYELKIGESDRWDDFWTVLCSCLSERHEAAPVHSLDEIKLLQSRFPQNIRLFTIEDADGIEAGVCVYDTGIVAHSQYIATTDTARINSYLPALFHHLLTDTFADRRYFDFGTSNENGGRLLNEGLLNQKFSMGGTGVVYPTYSLSL